MRKEYEIRFSWLVAPFASVQPAMSIRLGLAHGYFEKDENNLSALLSFSMSHSFLGPRLTEQRNISLAEPFTGPINPVAGQYANFTITYRLHNGTTLLSAFWNISYEEPIAFYPGCINATITLYDPQGDVKSDWWMVVNKTDRKVVAESQGVWGEGYYPYWIQTDIYSGQNITWWSTPHANATVLGETSIVVLNRTLDSWYIYSNLTSKSPVDPADLNNTAYFDKTSGHAMQILEYETGGYWNLTLLATNIPVGRGRVLFDMLHVEQFRFYYGYSELSEELRARGYALYQFGREQWDAGQLTYDLLENFDILVLPNPQVVRFAPSEVQSIIDFVQNGGGLLALGGSYPVTDSQYPVKDIISYFGIEYQLPITKLNAHVTDILPHPVTTGVEELYMPFVEALNITGAAQGVAFSESKPVVAVAESGDGRVAVAAAEHMLTNSFIEMYDNMMLALNTFGWLSKLEGAPYPQELPIVQITYWNPPAGMIVDKWYTVDVTVRNLGKNSTGAVVTIPNGWVFNKTGWGVGELLLGDSKTVSISSGATEAVSLAARAVFRGYAYLVTYVYASFSSSYLVFDGKYTSRIEITEPAMFSIYTDKYTYHAGDEMHLGVNVTNPDGSAFVDFAIWATLPDNSTYLYLYLASVTIPAHLEYGNPYFRTITLPKLPSGTYVWHAAFLERSTHEIIVEDTAEWQFTYTFKVKSANLPVNWCLNPSNGYVIELSFFS